MQNTIFYSEEDNKIFIRAHGHITAPLCYGLRQKVFNRFDINTEINGIYADLSGCDYMDSTFMGLLIGFNKKLEQMYQKQLYIIQPSKESKLHLADLGLDKILAYSEKDMSFPVKMEIVSQKEKVPAEFVLKAHEDLMELTEENRKKFLKVKEMLTKQIEEKNRKSKNK
ncbi:MAG: STAS domain-containing protein [Spirochaetales bacterium]|nr:STAS domain-containing protein [Spirochaetales bacterium]